MHGVQGRRRITALIFMSACSARGRSCTTTALPWNDVALLRKYSPTNRPYARQYLNNLFERVMQIQKVFVDASLDVLAENSWGSANRLDIDAILSDTTIMCHVWKFSNVTDRYLDGRPSVALSIQAIHLPKIPPLFCSPSAPATSHSSCCSTSNHGQPGRVFV
jgi:hypothetical protein